MRRKACRLLAILLALTLLAGCGSIAPKEKTIVLSEEASEPENTEGGQSSQGFEVKKIVKLSLDKLDPNGIHPDLSKGVIGWIDNDNLMAMSLQINAIEQDQTPDTGVEQPTERIFTQFVRINYQYGFYDPILTLADVEAECFDVSADGTLAAYIAGNTMGVYDLGSGQCVQSCTRQVLASRVTFAQEGHDVYFTAAGDIKKLERMNVDTGEMEGVQGGKSYRALAASDKAQLICTQSGGEEQLSYRNGEVFHEYLLSGGKSSSSCILSSGEALVSYDGNLYLAGESGAQRVAEGVTAFDIGSDDMHIAYAQCNEDGTVDIRIG